MSPRRLQVAVSGGSIDPGPEVVELAEAVGRGIAEAGAVLVCGGLGGLMKAAARGAAEAGGDVIGVVPAVDPESANEHCTHVVATGIGHARNLAVVASADVVIAIDGEWGTLSEIAFARRIERPVVALRSWTLRGVGGMEGAPGVVAVDDPDEAVRVALEAIG